MEVEFTPQQERRIGEYFRISILIKGAFSLAEIIGGVAIFFVPLAAITDIVTHFAQSELLEDPNDFIATHSLQLAQQFALTSTTFIAIYLLSRGLIKLFLVVALLKNQLWAYPSSLVVLGLFVVYQLYQIALTFSPFLIALTLFDLVVMWFIWREYEVVRLRTAGVV